MMIANKNKICPYR